MCIPNKINLKTNFISKILFIYSLLICKLFNATMSIYMSNIGI